MPAADVMITASLALKPSTWATAGLISGRAILPVLAGRSRRRADTDLRFGSVSPRSASRA